MQQVQRSDFSSQCTFQHSKGHIVTFKLGNTSRTLKSKTPLKKRQNPFEFERKTAMWSQSLTGKWKCSWRSREEQYKVARCSRLEFSAGWHHLLSLWHLKVWNLEWLNTHYTIHTNTHIDRYIYVRVSVVSFLWNARKSLFIYYCDVFLLLFWVFGKGVRTENRERES